MLLNGAAGAGAAAAAGAAVAVGGGGGGAFGVGNGLNMPLIPWGQLLPAKVEETLPHFPFGTTPSDGAWQVVNGTRFKFFVYSAYFDRRDGARLVRVIGATKTRGPERVWCRFWYGPTTHNHSETASSSSSSMRAKYTSATVMARVKVSWVSKQIQRGTLNLLKVIIFQGILITYRNINLIQSIYQLLCIKLYLLLILTLTDA